MKANQLPILGFFTKLYNRKSQRYFIIDGLGYNKNTEVDRIGLLDLQTRIRIWRPIEEVRQLMLDDVLEQWWPTDENIF